MNTAPPRSHFVKRIGQTLVGCGVAVLIVAGPLQPHVTAMLSSEGIYIPDANHQFTPQEVATSDKMLVHSFTLYNGRAQPLQIEASADCGCTGLSWQSATLPRFGSKNITASMNSSKYSSNVRLSFKLGKSKYAFASLKQIKP